jgi:hypothetical protein
MSDDISQYERQIGIILGYVSIVGVFLIITSLLWYRRIHKKEVNRERGFSWERNEEWCGLRYHDDDLPYSRYLEYRLERELKAIENKYKDKDDPVSKQKEIDDLIQFMDRLRVHLQNRRVFQRDPEKQTELEKMIINAPPIPPGDHDFSVYVLKDPESGMYFHRISGTPELSPDMNQEYWEWVRIDSRD